MKYIWALTFSFLTLLSGYGFWLDLQGYFVEVLNPVAEAKAVYRTVRRLPEDSLIWDHSVAGSLFALGDTVSTGEKALATVRLYAGGEIDLDPSTMVTLSGSKDKVQLRFVNGSGKVKVLRGYESQIEVLDNPVGVEIEFVESLEGGGIIGSRSARESLKSELVNSRMQISDPGRQVSQLDSKGKILLATDEPLAPVLQSPRGHARIILKSGRRPTLQWRLEVPAKISRDIAISRVRNDHYLVTVQPIDGKQKRIRKYKTRQMFLPIRQLGEGRFLWWVNSVSAKGVLSKNSKKRNLTIVIPREVEAPVALPVEVE